MVRDVNFGDWMDSPIGKLLRDPWVSVETQAGTGTASQTITLEETVKAGTYPRVFVRNELDKIIPVERGSSLSKRNCTFTHATKVVAFGTSRASVNISSVAANADGYCTFACASAHGLEVGEYTTIAGFSGGNAAYNGRHLVTGMADTTHFEIGVTWAATGTGTSTGTDGYNPGSSDVIIVCYRSSSSVMLARLASILAAAESCEDKAPMDYGTAIATGSDTTHLADSTKAWPTNSLEGYVVRIYAGTGAGTWREIVSNTATILAWSGAATTPDATSKYVIYPGSKSMPTNIGTIKTNTDPLVTADGGGYVRQDSTGTFAKETGGHLEETADHVHNIDLDEATGWTDLSGNTTAGVLSKTDADVNGGTIPGKARSILITQEVQDSSALTVTSVTNGGPGATCRFYVAGHNFVVNDYVFLVGTNPAGYKRVTAIGAGYFETADAYAAATGGTVTGPGRFFQTTVTFHKTAARSTSYAPIYLPAATRLTAFPVRRKSPWFTISTSVYKQDATNTKPNAIELVGTENVNMAVAYSPLYLPPSMGSVYLHDVRIGDTTNKVLASADAFWTLLTNAGVAIPFQGWHMLEYANVQWEFGEEDTTAAIITPSLKTAYNAVVGIRPDMQSFGPYTLVSDGVSYAWYYAPPRPTRLGALTCIPYVSQNASGKDLTMLGLILRY